MISSNVPSRIPQTLLRFEEAYFDRIWGGEKLRTILGKKTPPDRVLGEAWLISDHPLHQSVVSEGLLAGNTLHELLALYPADLLGSRAMPTPHGRFPLLLKLLDAGETLSVQVHPDDATALRLGEPDAGKTEMWHILHADAGSTLICGMNAIIQPQDFIAAIEDSLFERYLKRFPVAEGTSVFVPSGTVHAIGGGILLAEIQQNSNLTYRVYDWGRQDTAENARPLHIAKALQSIHFGALHSGPAQPLRYGVSGGQCTVLAACPYFAAECWEFDATLARTLSGNSFHIMLVKQGPVQVATNNTNGCVLCKGEALLLAGCTKMVVLNGPGSVLDYYVPDLNCDIMVPLRAAGYSAESIRRLGDFPETNGFL